MPISNCLIHAIWHGAMIRTRAMRNRHGRLHFYWLDREGRAYEFYAKGASSRTYFRNALYRGIVKRIPGHDISSAAGGRHPGRLSVERHHAYGD